MNCPVCKLLVSYLPVLKRTIECIKCSKLLVPLESWNVLYSDDKESSADDIELIPLDETKESTAEVAARSERPDFICKQENGQSVTLFEESGEKQADELAKAIKRVKKKRKYKKKIRIIPSRMISTEGQESNSFQGIVEDDYQCRGCMKDCFQSLFNFCRFFCRFCET